MSDMRAILKARFQLDPGSSAAEWQLVENLLAEYPVERDTILRWVYAELPGYVWTRMQAGELFIADFPEEGWQIVERLIQSEDPDDRDTALSLLVKFDDPRGPMLTRSMLHDPWPYLQFDAIEYLKNVYPTEAREALLSLLQHEDLQVRKQASMILNEFNP